MKKFSLSFVVSGTLFLLSLTWLSYTSTMPFSSSVTSFGGPATFPSLVLCVMIVCSAIVTIGEYRKMRRSEGGALPDMAIVRLVAGLLVVSFVHLVIMEFAGYIPGTIFLFLASLLLFGVRSKIMLASVSLGSPLVLYFVFQGLLGVQLP